MNKKDERIFNPVKVQRKGRWKWIVLGFLAFVLVHDGLDSRDGERVDHEAEAADQDVAEKG